MDEVVQFLFFLMIFTGIGVLFALPVLIPSFRRWLRLKLWHRVSFVIVYGMIILLLLGYSFSYLIAQIQTSYLCDYVVYYDTFGIEQNFINNERQFTDTKHVRSKPHFDEWMNCTDSHAVELGFVNEEKMKEALVQEFFMRSISPPFFRQNCYQDNPEFCELVDSFTFATSDNGYFFAIASYLWSILLTGYLILHWTQPKKEELDGGEP